MLGYLAVGFMALAAIAGVGLAINFFWQIGKLRAFAHALIIVGIFLAFWASGIWDGASKHAWGKLAPLIIALYAAGWLLLELLFKLGKSFHKNSRGR